MFSDILREFQTTGRLISPDSTPSASKPSPKPTALHTSSAVNLMATFDLDFTLDDSASIRQPGSQTSVAQIPRSHPITSSVNAEPPTIIPESARDWLSLQDFDVSHAQSTPVNTLNSDHHPSSTSFAHSDPSNFIHPGPADPYQFQGGTYLPEVNYYGNSNAPFPGIIPGILFAPDSWREDAMHREPITEE